jgi:hypothetical protein
VTVGEASAAAVLGGLGSGGLGSGGLGGSDESKRVREKNEGRESWGGGSGEGRAHAVGGLAGANSAGLS